MNQKGFTLTELLAVIAILAILSVGAISGYTTMTRNSRKKSYETKVAEIENAAVKYAEETSLTNTTNISVNKLVVEGYIQPDESTDSGLASIKNPENNENMICNVVRITVNDDIYIAEYDEKNKDCLIAEQELADLEISVEARKLDGNSITGNLVINGGVTSWTNTDVLLIVSSEKYTDFSSISYDFDGMTITKEKKGAPISTATEYNENDYDKIAIKDVVVMFNSEVTITYNMNDGSTHSRTVIVRIDKEAPTARMTVSNDVTVASTKKVNLYLDDANGSGVKGFYVSQSTDFSNKPLINSTDKSGSKDEGKGSFAGYNSYFYGGDGEYYIKVIDNSGNTFVTDKIVISNFDSDRNSCKIYVQKLSNKVNWLPTDETWYNEPIRVVTESKNKISSMGIKYFFGTVNVGEKVLNKDKLVKDFIPKGTNNKLSDFIDQTNDSDLKDYHTSMQGFSNLNKDISYCSKTIGVDKVNPTISFSCDDCNKYEKTHTLKITLLDDRSGFYDTAKSIQVGFSTSNTIAPTDSEWITLSGGTLSNYKNDSNKTIKNGKVTFSKSINANADGKALTGDYYIWVKKDSFEDKAHNNAAKHTPSNFVILYDNTPPTCTSSGGKSEWQKAAFNIYGTCSDAHSKCATHEASGKITYGANGNVTKKYDEEIDSTKESPGRVYDNAGNHTDCAANQEVHIDLHDPTCTSSGGSDAWRGISSSPVVTTGTCSDTGGSDCTGNVSKTYNTNTNKSESPGTVYDKSGRSAVCQNQTVKLDIDRPTVTDVKVESAGSKYNTANVNITVSGSDTGGSGVSKVCILKTTDVNGCEGNWQNFNGNQQYTNISAAASLDGSAVKFYVWIKDVAGNISDQNPATVTLEGKESNPYSVYIECSQQVNDGNATCGTDYGTCSDACGGKKYATLIQKRKDKYTSKSCASINTPNSASCSADCGGSVVDRNNCTSWQWTACSDACGGTHKQIRTCNKKSSDGTKACSGTVTEETNTGTACGGKVVNTDDCTKWKWTACDKNGKKKQTRTCKYKSQDGSKSCSGETVETKNENTSCCSESNTSGCPTWYACDSTMMIFHKKSLTCSTWSEESGDHVTAYGVITPVKLIEKNAATFKKASMHKIEYNGTVYYVRAICLNSKKIDCSSSCPG